MKYTFAVDFGAWPKYSNYASFDLELTDEEAGFIRAFLKENGDVDYIELESESPELFDRINDAANEAVLATLNKGRKKKLDFFDVDWSYMGHDFYWPDELMK